MLGRAVLPFPSFTLMGCPWQLYVTVVDRPSGSVTVIVFGCHPAASLYF